MNKAWWAIFLGTLIQFMPIEIAHSAVFKQNSCVAWVIKSNPELGLATTIQIIKIIGQAKDGYYVQSLDSSANKWNDTWLSSMLFKKSDFEKLDPIVCPSFSQQETNTDSNSGRPTWGYRTCFKDSNKCLKYSAVFFTKEDCEEYIERFGHRCLSGGPLVKAAVDEAVCWKAELLLARSECNRLD